MSEDKELKGNCLCGAVRITAQPADNRVDACHCKMCQRWGGGPLLTIRGGTDVRFEGADNITTYSSSDWAERGFCRQCGTHLFYRLRREGSYALPVGLLDHHDDLLFDQQIFIDRKPSFYAFENATTNLTGAEVMAQYWDSSEPQA